MHVAIVAPEDLPIPPNRGGSVQIYLHALCEALGQHPEIRVTLLCPGGHGSASRSVRIIPVTGGKKAYRTRVLAHLTRIQPDVVQIDNRPDLVTTVRHALPRARIVLNLHSTTFLAPRHIRPSEIKTVFQSADRVVVNSTYLKTVIANRLHLHRSDWNPFVIHPGVDLTRFQRGERHTVRFGQNPFQVIYIGRVIRQKGVDVLVSSIRHLHHQGHSAHLTIVGRTPPWEGQYGQSIHKSIRGYPIRWVGFVAPEKLPRYLWKSQVLVCPSQNKEAFGMVNVEAMAAGLPVIASRQGGIPEIVNNSCGILVDDYTHSLAFAQAIQRVMDNPDLWEQLHLGAKKRATQFTWDKVARDFILVYCM